MRSPSVLAWRFSSIWLVLWSKPCTEAGFASGRGKESSGRRGPRRCTRYAIRSRGKEMASGDTERTAYRCRNGDRSMRYRVDQTHRTSMSNDDQIVPTRGPDLHHQDQRRLGRTQQTGWSHVSLFEVGGHHPRLRMLIVVEGKLLESSPALFSGDVMARGNLLTLTSLRSTDRASTEGSHLRSAMCACDSLLAAWLLSVGAGARTTESVLVHEVELKVLVVFELRHTFVLQ